MLKNKYIKPMFLEANGTIHLTTSQLAALGVGDVAGWDEFWAEAEEYAIEIYPNFNVNDPTTWPSGFSLGDPETWDILLFPED